MVHRDAQSGRAAEGLLAIIVRRLARTGARQRHKPEVKSFPLFNDTPLERRHQLDEAQAWATHIRRRMNGGIHFSTRAAERMTLGEALRRYERDTLDSDNPNRRKDINRIHSILLDPIAQRAFASLRSTNMAAYRDQLIHRG